MTKDSLMSFYLTVAGTVFWWKMLSVRISFAPFSLIRASAKQPNQSICFKSSTGEIFNILKKSFSLKIQDLWCAGSSHILFKQRSANSMECALKFRPEFGLSRANSTLSRWWRMLGSQLMWKV